MLGLILNDLAQVDEWLDQYVSDQYKAQPMAQDWARISKIGEELVEVIEAWILHTGQNPRKGEGENMDAVMKELTDVAYTAMLAMLHFTKDPVYVGKLLIDAKARLYDCMVKDKRRRMHEQMETARAIAELSTNLSSDK